MEKEPQSPLGDALGTSGDSVGTQGARQEKEVSLWEMCEAWYLASYSWDNGVLDTAHPEVRQF